MADPALAVLAALAILQAKHLICDFFLQTSRQIENKGTYGHAGGLIHAGLHVLGTLPIFAIYPVRLVVAIAILVLEFVAHYHIDWLKAVINRRYGWTPRDKSFWTALGIDQFAHQITYLVMILALVLIER